MRQVRSAGYFHRPGIHPPLEHEANVRFFVVTILRRQPQPRQKSVVELLAEVSIPSTANSERCRELDEALGRFLDAQRARERQAELADQFAGEYVDVLVGANSQERYAAAITIAEAYDEARSLTQIELDLMVAEMIIRIPDYEDREKDIQNSQKEYESFGIPENFIKAAARWRQVAEFERSRSSTQGPTKIDFRQMCTTTKGTELASPELRSSLGPCAEHGQYSVGHHEPRRLAPTSSSACRSQDHTLVPPSRSFHRRPIP
jgi:hypothetical protein